MENDFEEKLWKTQNELFKDGYKKPFLLSRGALCLIMGGG